MIDFSPMVLSFKLAFFCTCILIVTGVPLAYWLSSSVNIIKLLVRSVIMLPLILPPSVLGFYFLILWSPVSPFGHFFESIFHFRLVFSFEGLILASTIAGLPFMLNPLIAGFESVPSSLAEAAKTLGKGKIETLIHVLLPSIKPSFFIGVVMSFVHTFGEFGLVLMLGGKIPGKTLTASIALYDHVEALEYTQAHIYAAGIAFSALTSMVLLFILNNKMSKSK